MRWLTGGLLITSFLLGASCEESELQRSQGLDASPVSDGGQVALDSGATLPGDAAVPGDSEPRIADALPPGDKLAEKDAMPADQAAPKPDQAAPKVDTGGPKLPDFVVFDFSWSPASPIAGAPVTFSATIKNVGAGASPAGVIHAVSFWIDGAWVAWSDSHTQSMPPGASVKLTANGGPTGSAVWYAQAGTRTVEAFVDDVDRIEESNENNNKLQKTIAVSGPVVSCELTVASGNIVKNAAGATVHTGADAIQWALDNAKTVCVTAGTFQVGGELFLQDGDSLIGAGTTSTTLNFSSGAINMAGVSNTTVKGLRLTGAVSLSADSHAGTIRNHIWEDILLDHVSEGRYPYAVINYLGTGGVIDGVVYRRVVVDSPHMGGFFNNSDDTPGCWIKNILYEDCQALRVGIDVPDHYGHGNAFVWLPGFDLAERANVDRMTLINCRADYNWEAGFHFENDPEHLNIVFKNCTASYNGQKPAGFDNKDGWSYGPLYGGGFFMGAYSKRGNITGLETCTGTGNAKPLVVYDMSF